MTELVHLITIQNGSFSATIDPMGAWITSFSHAGQPIFYDKQEIAVGDVMKVRGGCHVCLPNFGPGTTASGLAQHGYGRTTMWSVESQSDDGTVLALASNISGWEGLTSKLHYRLTNSGITMELSVTNSSEQSLEVAPGFHPYFATGDVTEVTLNDKTYDVTTLDPVQFLEGSTMSVHIGERQYLMSHQDLPVWALWTDRLGEYICLEPTDSGFSFEEGTAKNIQPGQMLSWSFTLSLVVS